MNYLLLLLHAPDAGPQEGTPELDDEMRRWSALNDEMKRAGVLVLAAGIQGPESATTLRTPGGERVLTDGPFAETKEVLFSVYVLDVPDLDAAVEWANRMPNAEYGSVDIRPVVGLDLP